MRRLFRLSVALALTIALGSAAFAQNFPDRPISWVVGFAPGGVSDQGARFVAKVVSQRLGQSVVVENKAGAGGIVGTEYVAQAKPDGYTLLYGAAGPLGIFKSLYKKLTYDPLESFTLINGLGVSPLILVVPANSPFKTLKDLIAFAKNNPNKLNYGSVGAGSAAHLAAEMLATDAGIKMVHVPYKGSAPAMTDVLGGSLDLIFDYSIVVKPLIEGGKLRPLGSTGSRRLASHPDLATFGELGYPGVNIASWGIIAGPANMPPAVVDKLSKAFSDALKDPAVIKFYDEQGLTLMPDLNGPKLREFVISEQAKFKTVIERTGATAN